MCDFAFRLLKISIKISALLFFLFHSTGPCQKSDQTSNKKYQNSIHNLRTRTPTEEKNICLFIPLGYSSSFHY